MRSAERRGGGRHEPKREERRGSSAAARCGVDGDGLLEIEKEVKHYMEEDELEYGRLWGWGRTNNTSSTASLLPDSLFHTAPRHSVSGEETREREWSSPTGGYVQRGRHKTDHWVTCAGTRPHEFVWHLRDNVGMKSVCVCVCVCVQDVSIRCKTTLRTSDAPGVHDGASYRCLRLFCGCSGGGGVLARRGVGAECGIKGTKETERKRGRQRTRTEVA